MKTDIYEKLLIPENDKSTPISKIMGEYIFSFLREKNITDTLEIGFGYGVASAYIISATKSLHYTIDPFQSNYGNLGLKNLHQLEFDSLLNLEEDFSHNVLPELVKQNKKFDFIFIDGGHKFDEVFVDCYYSDLLLKDNGYIFFDDSWLASVRMVNSWMINNKKNYINISTPIKHTVMFQKKASDNRSWSHFEMFSPSHASVGNKIYKFIFMLENLLKSIWRTIKK